MAAPIYNPAVPYLGPVFGGMTPGRMISIQGTSHPNAQRFSINLQCGPNYSPRDDIALHIDVRYHNSTIVRNAYLSQQWGHEDYYGPFPLVRGQPFEFLILAEPHSFKIALNGLHHAEFVHRTPVERVSYLAIDGDTNLSCIRFDTVHAPMSAPAPPPAYSGGSGMPMPAPFPPQAPPPPYQVVGGPSVPYHTGTVVVPPVVGGYPRQAHTGVTYTPPAVYTYPRSPQHSSHISRSAAIPIAGGAAAGLLTGALLMGHHHKAKRSHKWVRKGFKHKGFFKHKHKHGFHFHHGFHHSSSSSEEE